METGQFEVTYAHYRVPELVAEQLKRKGATLEGSPEGKHLLPYSRKQKNQFIPHPTGGKTVVKVHDLETDKYYTASAVCSYGDNFCYRLGREVALSRVLALMKL